MTTRTRRRLMGLVAIAGLAAGTLVVAGPAAATEGTNEDPHIDLTNLPIDPINCDVEGAPDAFLTFCIEMTFNGGQAKFGSVQSSVSGPIKVRQVISVVIGPGGFEDLQLVTIDEGGTGGGGLSFPTINVPGGLLGAAAAPLDPILSPVTGIQASIEPLGALTLNDVDSNPLLAALFGDNTAAGTLATVNLPFQVRIKNLLLGTSCLVGNASDPVELNLPLNISSAEYWNGSFADPQTNLIYLVMDADATDATFDVPAADGCGIVELDLGSGNVFDNLVNQFVGLPAPSGTNLLSMQGYFGLTIPGGDGITPAPAP